jgi:hypothetical protein
LIDYLWYERYTPRRGADPNRLPANFTMKGRTLPALVTRMERWHRQLTTEVKIAREQWEPSGIGAFTWDERHEHDPQVTTHWTIREITTAKGLIAEGRAMSHCVASYSGQCARGSVSIWSLQAESGRYSEPIRVMTIAVHQNRTITEARGKRNALPTRSGENRINRSYARLSAEEERLLNRGWAVMERWASAERLSMPAYLLAR